MNIQWTFLKTYYEKEAFNCKSPLQQDVYKRYLQFYIGSFCYLWYTIDFCLNLFPKWDF